MSDLLLLSGGLDSVALAALRRPQLCMTVDYGQVPAAGEVAASTAVARELGLSHIVLAIPTGQLGSGLLVGDDSAEDARPSPEWWPFRNQMLVTFAAAWALKHEFDTIVVGTVATDRSRHADGTPEFFRRVDALVSSQEGGIRVAVPAIDETTVELVRRAELADSILGWTHSCHVSPIACGQCPGCEKRLGVLEALGRLQDVDLV